MDRTNRNCHWLRTRPEVYGTYGQSPEIAPDRGSRLAILLFALRDQFGINLAGVVVGFLSVREFGLGNLGSLLRPALIDSGKTPFGALTRGANGFSVHQNENGVGMRRTQDAPCQPTALLDRHIKGNLPNSSVCHNVLAGDRFSVHHKFHRHLSRASDARPLDMPKGLAIHRPVMDAVG